MGRFAGYVSECLAVSKDGRWIAGGTMFGEVIVWDAKTFKKVFSHRDDAKNINGADFSPDSTRLISASRDGTVTIWDITSRKRVQTLEHTGSGWVTAAKYSPQGDRIATATFGSVRVWDSNNGRLLQVGSTSLYDTGLLWFSNHLFTMSDSKIKQIEASTGSAFSEWPVSKCDHFSCIALPEHGEFIACSTRRIVTFWDTATHIDSVSSNTFKTYVRLHSHQTTGFSQLVERAGKSPLIVCSPSR